MSQIHFEPYRTPSSLFPPLFWRGFQVSGFGSIQPAQFVEGELPDILKDLYPELSICELARLSRCLDIHHLDAGPVLAAYGIMDREVAEPIFNYILSLSDDLQRALADKQMQMGDYRSILPVPEIQSEGRQLLARCLRLRMSKSQLVEACELGNEVLQMGGFEIIHHLDRDQLLNALREARYPESRRKDKSRADATKKQKWPTRAQAKWSRQGDTAGLEVKFFVSSQHEYKKALQLMNDIQVEEIWNAHSTNK